jgi:phosphate transport system protein
VNEIRYRVENAALQTIALHQPTARDLRLIVAASHMASELERIGDHAVGIANVSLRIADAALIKPLIDIPRMQEIVCAMVHGALDAYVNGNVVLAQQVTQMDEQVDALYSQILRELLTYMMQDTATVNGATYLQWVSHNLERIGDRATNLCERVIFTATGELGDHKVFRPRDE